MHEEDQDSSSTNPAVTPSMPSPPSVGNPSPGQLSPHQPPPTAVYHPPPPGAPMYPHPGHLPPQLPPPTAVLIPPAQSTNYNTDTITNQYNCNYYGPVHNSGQAQDVPQNRGMAQEDPGSAGDSAFTPRMESMTNLIESYKNMIQNKKIPQVFIPMYSSSQQWNNEAADNFIYIDRTFIKEDSDKTQFSSLNDIANHEIPTLIQGEAGCGKSFLWSKTAMDWADGNILENINLLINISARDYGNESIKIPLKSLTFHFTSLSNVDTQLKQLEYKDLELLCVNNKLGLSFDGLDELPNLSVTALQEIKYQLLKAIEDPAHGISFLQFVIGILTKQIFKGAVVLATGRPQTVQMVYSKLMNKLANVFTLKPFQRPDVRKMIHKICCGGAEGCQEDPSRQQCTKITNIVESNSAMAKLTETPAICESIILYIYNKIKSGEEVNANNVSLTVVKLGIILKNFQHKHVIGNVDGFTDMVDTEDGDALLNICQMCCLSLQNDAILIKGHRVRDGGKDFFKSTYGKISLEYIEKSGVFKIVGNTVGQITISTKHLSDHEFLASAFACSRNSSDLERILQKMSLERSIAVLTYIASLVSGEDPVQLNFMQYLKLATNTSFETEDIIRDIYCQVSNISIPEHRLSKTLNFTVCMEGGEMRTSQVVLLSKLVSITKIPANVTINQTPKSWTLTIISPGWFGYTSNELEDILSFLDIQNTTPAVVNIERQCRTTAVINQYVSSHPGIALNISQGCWFYLFSQEDITGFLELASSRHIDIQRVGSIDCTTMCDVAAIPSLTSLMAKVYDFAVYGEQKDDFWSLMHHQTDENNSQFGRLELGYFKTTYTNLKHIFPLLKRAREVWFYKLVIENSHLSHLSSAFQNQQLNNISELEVSAMEIGLDNVESWAGCLGAVGYVMVWDMEVSEDVWCKMGDCLVAMANNGRLKLKTLRIFGKKSQLIEENFKKAGVNCMTY